MATSKTASCFQLGVRFADGTLLRQGSGVANLTLPSTSNTLAGQLAGDGTIFSSSLVVASAAGTITLPTPQNQTANKVFAGPTSGGAAAPTFRSLVAGDIPALAYVTSVALTMPSIFSVSGSPITSSGTLAVTLANETANTVFAGPTTGAAAAPTFRALVAADIPALAYVTGTGLTSGQLIVGAGSSAIAVGNLSGDATTSGSAAVTVVKLRGASLDATIGTAGAGQDGQVIYWDNASSSYKLKSVSVSVTWDQIGNAAGNLTLANAGFTTTFNQTSSVLWTWANTTAATSGGTVSSSPQFSLNGRLFNSGVDTAAGWTKQTSISAAISKAATNISETAGSVVTLTVGSGHGFVAGNWITCTSFTTGSWLNNQNARITSVTSTTITFTDPTSHGTQASTATTGTVTQIPTVQFVNGLTGTSGDYTFVLPSGGTFAVNAPPRFTFSDAPSGYGFSLGSTSLAGLAISSPSNAAAAAILFYTGAIGSLTQKASISVGDTSQGNSVIALSAIAVNFGVGLASNYTTANSGTGGNAALILGNSASFTATSGEQVGIGMGYSQTSVTPTLTFAPTSGTATFKAVGLKYTVNQTGGANGNVTGLWVSAIETAVGGLNYLLDLQAGTAGTTSRLSIDNVGIVRGFNFPPRLLEYNPCNSGNPTGSGVGYGFNLGGFGSTGTIGDVTATATAPHGFSLTTLASNPASAGCWVGVGTAGIEFCYQTIVSFKWWIKLSQTTTTRIWIGVSEQTNAAATFRSDAPASTSFIGFRYSTAAGDTKYMCVTNNNGTQTATAETTATHVDTSVHQFEIRWDGTNAVFYIDGVQVGAQSTNLPSTTRTLAPVMYIDNTATANAVAFTMYGFRGVLTL